MRMRTLALLVAVASASPLSAAEPPKAAAASHKAAAAPTDGALAGLTGVYDKIADTIVATNHSETAIVRAILQAEHDLATAALDRASAPGAAGVTADLRTAAARIGDFATEGGAAVEPIRNRLLEAGHHHNANDTGPEAVYETGYVCVTKKQKVEALDLAKRAAKLAETGKADAAEIKAIRDGFTALATHVFAAK